MARFLPDRLAPAEAAAVSRVLLEDGYLGMGREVQAFEAELAVFLGERGLDTGVHYSPNHLLELYGGGRERLPVTEQLYGELLSLPLHPELNDSQADGICDLVTAYLAKQGDDGGS